MTRRVYAHEWEVYWEGHYIVVRTWLDSLFRGGEDVFLDGNQLPSEQWEPWRLQSSSNIYHTLVVDGEEREIHVHVGNLVYPVQGRGNDKTGCLILVDEVPIGGDIGKEFDTIEPATTSEPGHRAAYRNLVEVAKAQSQAPENLPWWVWVYSWVIAHRLRTLLVITFIAYVIWELTIGD